MASKGTAIVAFILLIALVIIVVVGLSWNPSPAEVCVTKKCEMTAAEILCQREKDKRQCNSGMTPPVRCQLSPESVASSSNSPWEALDKMRCERQERNKKPTVHCH